jgi:hypothetical protein
MRRTIAGATAIALLIVTCLVLFPGDRKDAKAQQQFRVFAPIAARDVGRVGDPPAPVEAP